MLLFHLPSCCDRPELLEWLKCVPQRLDLSVVGGRLAKQRFTAVIQSCILLCLLEPSSQAGHLQLVHVYAEQREHVQAMNRLLRAPPTMLCISKAIEDSAE